MTSLPAAPHPFSGGGAASISSCEKKKRPRKPSKTVPFVGTAGWSISKELKSQFPCDGTHLQRYASHFSAVEINSSFYRSHRKVTYERWAESTPDGFRFSVKMPRTITHQKKLCDCATELDAFFEEVDGLQGKLGVVLVQLPPSLTWDEMRSSEFFMRVRDHYSGPIALEPRHRTWFEEEPESQFVEYRISRVAADPSIGEKGAIPAGDAAISYFRWHGSPRMYYSNYDDDQIRSLAKTLIKYEQSGSRVWCIFDNTAANAALKNAMSLSGLFAASEPIIDG